MARVCVCVRVWVRVRVRVRLRVRVRVRVGLRVRFRVRVLSAAVVRLVVREPQQRRALRADPLRARLELGRTAHLWLREEPEAIVRRAGGDVGGDVVVGVDEPVRGGGLVDREPREGLARVGAEVVRDHVLGLDPVLDEEGVAWLGLG